MSDFSLTLVLHFKTSKNFNGMAKVQIKSEKITPFGGIFHVREHFSRFVGPVIDKVLGLRCTSFGYQYSEIVGSLSSVYFSGGDCVEDVTSHLMPHLSLHPTLRGTGSSRAREFHPLTEPCVKVSPHTALHTLCFVHMLLSSYPPLCLRVV